MSGMKRGEKIRGFSLIELLIAIAIILVIVSISAPYYHRWQMTAREMAAQAEIRTLQQAERSYFSETSRYAMRLEELKEIIPASLTSGRTRSSYPYDLKAAPGGYQIHARPSEYGSIGRKTFLSDQSMRIWEHSGPEPATPQDREISAASGDKWGAA